MKIRDSKSIRKKIGIDAKWFFSGPVSNRIVIQNLVEHLILQNPGHELSIFLDRKHKYKAFPFTGPNVNLVYVWAGNNLVSNLFLLPFLGLRLKLDGILFQNFGSFFGPDRWVYIHDVIFLSHPQFFSRLERIYFSLMPVLLRFASKIITISRSEKDRILTHCPGIKAPVFVVHHGRNDAFKPENEFSLEEKNRVKKRYNLPEPYLLFVGRLNDRKNLGNLLLAIRNLKYPVPLVVVGEENWQLAPDLKVKLSEGQTQGLVILTGKVPFSDLPILYSMALLFCFPSYVEGFGLPVLEAMSAGVPVATSGKSAMSEICGDAAQYFEPESWQSIAECLTTLISDSSLRQSLLEKGLIRATEFNWKKSASELFKILG